MTNLHIGECPALEDGTIEIRRYLKSDELVRLAKTGCTESRDEPLSTDETTEVNVERLYKLASVDRPAHFTSLAIMIRRTSNGKTALALYGGNVLVVKPEVLRDTLVVNGDMKNVGRYIQDGDTKNVFVRRGTEVGYPELLKLVENNRPNTTGLRLRGTYFEGRLLRALRVEDVQAIYVRYEDDEQALTAARAILNGTSLKPPGAI